MTGSLVPGTGLRLTTVDRTDTVYAGFRSGAFGGGSPGSVIDAQRVVVRITPRKIVGRL
ncbi:hypothetical protein [Kitasatospora sp. NPDC096140]|uniref:hypothetical protein n=1 Tax=Kitasatospora sp. NPDC096140 TaxID=3155425 RepID=UPI003333F277